MTFFGHVPSQKFQQQQQSSLIFLAPQLIASKEPC